MKSGGPLKRTKGLKPGTSQMKRTAFARKANAGMTSSGFKKASDPSKALGRKPSKRVSKRQVDEKHLAFVRTLPCLVCFVTAGTAHHLLRTPERAGARRSDDRHSVPLCQKHHMALHADGNEIEYLFTEAGIPRGQSVQLSEDIYAVSGKFDQAVAIITTCMAGRENIPLINQALMQ